MYIRRTCTDQIWKAIQHKDFLWNAHYFLWMATHSTYQIGKYWLKEISAKKFKTDVNACSVHCGTPETMDHILTQCESPGQKKIWELAEQIWTQKNLEWRQPWIGNIICCALTEFRINDGKCIAGAEHLWRILISESAHLIWKIHCDERVIRNENNLFTPKEVRNQWYKMMDDHLKIDCRMTSPRFGKKSLKSKTITNTWKGTLKNKEDLPSNWTEVSGVLVGRSWSI
ncbi:hypothetical protein L208DRAFT_1515877 [Tricholoma matsutake]|nr:hypothetical protein L208DRAFT_1515877 [Tricholoma matsutake 945]